MLPLPTAIPLLGAALIAVSDHIAPRRLKNSIALGAAAASLVFALLIMLRTERGDMLHWFGGWRPNGNLALGIAFVADPFGAAMAALASGLVLLALAYSWTYMRESSLHFDILMLVFCAGMTGFAHVTGREVGHGLRMPQAGVGEATTTGGAQDGAAGQESAVAAVAVKVTGEPVRPAAVATKDCVPGAGPRVAVADAVPSDAVCETALG